MSPYLYPPVPSKWFNDSNFTNYSTKNIFFKIVVLIYSSLSKVKYKKSFCDLDIDQISSLSLEIGGGETPARKRYGYTNCDLRDLDSVDICCSAMDLNTHFLPGSVSTIFGRHFLEHLTWSEVFKFLNDSKALLQEDGTIEMIVPSFTFSSLQLLFHRPGHSVHLHGLAGLNGWQRDQSSGNYWDIHKSSYTHAIIIDIGHHLNMNVTFYISQPKEIHFSLQKI